MSLTPSHSLARSRPRSHSVGHTPPPPPPPQPRSRLNHPNLTLGSPSSSVVSMSMSMSMSPGPYSPSPSSSSRFSASGPSPARGRRRRSGTQVSSSSAHAAAAAKRNPQLTLHTPHERLHLVAPQAHLLRASIQRHILLWYSPDSPATQVAPQSTLSSQVAAITDEIEAIANASWSSTSSTREHEHADMELMDQLLTLLDLLKRTTAVLDNLIDLDMFAHGVQLDKAAQLAAALAQQVESLAAQSQDLGHCLDPIVFKHLASTIHLQTTLIHDRITQLSRRFFAFSADSSARKSSSTRKLVVTYELPLDDPPASAFSSASDHLDAFDTPDPLADIIALPTILDALAHLDLLHAHMSTLVDSVFTYLLDPLLDASSFHRVQSHTETLSASVRVHSDPPGPTAPEHPWQVHLDLVARVLHGLAHVLQHRGLLECIDRIHPLVTARVSAQIVPFVLDRIVLASVPDGDGDGDGDDAGGVHEYVQQVFEHMLGFRARVAETDLVYPDALDEMVNGVRLAQAAQVRARRGAVLVGAKQVLCSRDDNVEPAVENGDLAHFQLARVAGKGGAGAARSEAAPARTTGGVVIRSADTPSPAPNADPAPTGAFAGKPGGKLGGRAHGDLLGIDLAQWASSSSPSSSSSSTAPPIDLSLSRLPNYTVTRQTLALIELMSELAQRGRPAPTWASERDPRAALEAFEHVHDLVLLWLAVVPAQRGHALRTSPRAAALFRNDTECLLHHLVTLGKPFDGAIPRQWMSRAAVVDVVPAVVRAGNAVFKDMMVHLHMQFQAHLVGLGDLSDLHFDSCFDAAQAAVQDMLDQCERLDHDWKTCLPADMYLRSVGSLLDTYYAGLVAAILDTLAGISKRTGHALRFVLMQAVQVEAYFALGEEAAAAGAGGRAAGKVRAGHRLEVVPQVARYCPAYVKVVDVATLLSALSLAQGRSEAARVGGLTRDEALSLVERREY